ATAKIAYGARYIGVVDFADPTGQSALYGGIGVEAQIRFAIEVWLKIKLLIKTIKISFRFSLSIGFTASLEAGIMGLSLPGLRGAETAFKVPGYSIFVGRAPDPDGWVYFVLLPRGEQPAIDQHGHPVMIAETGFLPPPPDPGTKVTQDFLLRVPAPEPGEQY